MKKLDLYEKFYSGPLYHVTKVQYAINILRGGRFKLTEAPPGGKEIQNAPEYARNKGFIYFMSASRDKFNAFRTKHIGGDLLVTFVLNPDYFVNSNKYIINPTSYFSNASRPEKIRSEAEERIWSREGFILIDDVITEIHVNMHGMYIHEFYFELYELAKRRGIHCYFYRDFKKYNQLDKKYAGTRLAIRKNDHLIDVIEIIK